jgi:hypothetical protein
MFRQRDRLGSGRMLVPFRFDEYEDQRANQNTDRDIYYGWICPFTYLQHAAFRPSER